MNILNAYDRAIPFNNQITPDIGGKEQLNQTNELLPDSMKNILTSTEEIADIISSRPNKNSTGADDMPYTIMKQFDDRVLRGITIFFNHLLAIHHFPTSWQHAIITPIPKPGKDSSLIENWRPISMILCIAKIFERIIATRLNNHIHELNIYPHQYGFLKGNSTVHALANLQSDINFGLNNKRVTTIVALDLKAAFDTVWHNGLLHKMLKLDFPIHTIKIIQSMLSLRSFNVRLDGQNSDMHKMGAGVPQGSVVGPIIFNIYTHDIPLHHEIKISQFADDTTLYYTHSEPRLAQNYFNIYLQQLTDWFKNWKLKLVENKTELLHVLGQVRDTDINLRRRIRNMKITLSGHRLEPKNEIRLLGLQFQTNNRFTKNINIRLIRAKNAKFHLNRILRNAKINTKIKITMYKMYIRPILMYASPVWIRQPQVSSHQMERLRIFERQCLRNAANIRRPVGTYKHVKISDIYRVADCIRIDRFAVQNHLSFFNKAKHNVKFRNILKRFSGTYGSMPELLDQHMAGNLLINDRLEIFNRRYNGLSGNVYNTDQ